MDPHSAPADLPARNRRQLDDDEKVPKFGSLSKFSFGVDDDDYEAHSRRKVIRRRMLMDCLRAIPMQMCVTAGQLFLFIAVIFAIWVSWAFIFQDAIRFPELVDVDSWGPSQRTQSLTAYSELASMLSQTLLYGLPGDGISCYHNLTVTLTIVEANLGFLSIERLKLRPQRVEQGQYNQTELMASSPMVFILQKNSKTTFTVETHWDNKYGDIEGTFIKVENPLVFSLMLDVNLPKPEEDIYALELTVVDVNSHKVKWRQWILSFILNNFSRRFSPITRPDIVEAEIEKFERRLRAEESFRRSMTGYVGRSSPDQRRHSDIFTSTLQHLESDTKYCFANTPKRFERRQTEPKRRLQVPLEIKQLMETEQISGLLLWRHFLKGLLFTFAVNRGHQKDFKESITDLCQSLVM
uniref:Uncharacterized protein n=1 Tax=Spongospora subterranea TaxID=70186 RepID=A0A0H5QI24_9EUKA|eukprot:CRZ01628.1 hypothetical protein [Spongospora subterranea]